MARKKSPDWIPLSELGEKPTITWVTDVALDIFGFAEQYGLETGKPSPNDTTVHPKSTWSEHLINEEWVVACRLLPQDGEIVLAEVRIFPAESSRPAGMAGEWSAKYLGEKAKAPPAGITARLLKTIRLGPVRSEAHALVRQLVARVSSSYFDYERQRAAFWRDIKEIAKRPGRKGRPDIFWARIAQLYSSALGRGSLRPIQDTTEALKKRFNEYFSTSHVRDLVAEARRRGMLSPTRRGLPGGSLTPKAITVLKADEKRRSKGRRKK